MNPNRESWRFEYDAAGRLTGQRDYAGRLTEYRHDELGQVTEVIRHPLPGSADAPLVTAFEYDVLGRLTARETAEHRTEYRHNTLSLEIRRATRAEWRQALLEEREPEWDAVLVFTRNAAGELVSEENHGGKFEYEYDALGNLSSTLYPDGRELATLRYGTGHLLEMQLRHGGATHTLAAYGRDRLHREISRSQGVLSQETRYDAAGQVTKAVEPQKEERFFWDAAGNRTEEHRNPVWHNLLLRLDGLKLDYDGFGRLTRRQDKNGVIQHFAYDDEQRVKEIRFEGNTEFRRVEYRYDPLGRRTHKVLWRYNDPQPETLRFDWQGLQLAGEQSDREPDHYVQYVYTEGSYEPLARVDSVFDDCEIYWYHTELNGLPERVTDADGQTVWRGQFSTWGETERESGLHYNLFRYYDPVAGRYTQMDPIGLAGGLNTYSYVGDPLTWVDPLGLVGNIFIHYTDKFGFDRIMETGVIEANSKGKVYITDILMSPEDAMRDIFINDPVHNGRGDYAIIFKADAEQMSKISQSAELEYIHSGRLKVGEIFHAGKNPYTTLTHLSYEQRLGMTQEQIKSRGARCG